MRQPKKHFSEYELQQRLAKHNPDTRFQCQCMDCLYALWYWKSQYNMEYPQKPDWALDFKGVTFR